MSYDSEIPKYKKKSSAKGQPRANHKHQYISVCLHYITDWKWMHQPEERVIRAQVCSICGRINGIGWEHRLKHLNDSNEGKERAINALQKLPHWYCDSIFDKFAHQKDVDSMAENEIIGG